MKVKFCDLFEPLGTGGAAYSDRAAALAGSFVEISGWLVALQGERCGYALVDRPGAQPDVVAAIHLPGFQANASCESPVQLRGRLAYGFAVVKNGFASFLRLEDARLSGLSGRVKRSA